MFNGHDGGDGERGEAAIGYAGMVLLTALIVIALIAGGVAATVSQELADAICRVIQLGGGTADCRGPRPPGAPKPPGLPDLSACLRQEQSQSSTNNIDLLLYRRREYAGSSVDQYGDGSIVISQSKGSGNGVGLAVGYGGGFNIRGIGFGWGVDAGVGQVWTSVEQTSFTFRDQAQLKEFQARFDAWYAAEQARIKGIGDGRIRGAALNRLNDGKDQAKERIATEMGIPISHYYPKGTTGFANIGGNYGLGWASGGVTDANAQGRQFDSDGTVTNYYSREVTWSGQALLGPQIKKLVQAGLYLDADHHTTDLVGIHYDKQGNPVSVTVTNVGQGGITFGGGIGAGEHQYDGGQAGTGGLVKSFGGPSSVHVTTTTIPLAGNPDAKAIADLYRSTDGLTKPPSGQVPAGLQQALNQQTTAVQIYDRQRSNDGWDLSGTYYVEILGVGQQTVDQTQTLNAALYMDPQTGQLIPWADCKGTR